MATPQWTGRQSLAQPTVNPSAAINSASRVFGDISKQIQDAEVNEANEAYRQEQLALANQGMALKRQASEWDMQEPERRLAAEIGREERAFAARLAEESRLKANRSQLAKKFQSLTGNLKQSQLDNFTISELTKQALANAGYVDEQQLTQLLSAAKERSPELFVDHNSILSGVNKELLSQGIDPSSYQNLLSSYQNSNRMGSVDPDTLGFLQKAALSNSKGSGSSGSSSGGGSNNDANFLRNVKAIDDEKSFRSGSDAWYKDWFPGERTKVYKQDVTRIAEHALANNGIRPMYIAQAIKADMDGGQTKYNLADISTDNSNPQYQSILQAAALMQNNANGGNSGAPSGGSGVSISDVLEASRGYQPVSQNERQQALLDLAQSLFSSTQPTQRQDQAPQEADPASIIESVLSGNSSTNDNSDMFGNILPPTENTGIVDAINTPVNFSPQVDNLIKILNTPNTSKNDRRYGEVEEQKKEALSTLRALYGDGPPPSEEDKRASLAEVIARSRNALSNGR